MNNQLEINLLCIADTPPPAYSPSEDIKQGDSAMEIVSNGPSVPMIPSNVTPVQYQVCI